MIWENLSFLTFHFLRLWIIVLKFLFRQYYPPRISSMPKLTDHYMLKRYMGNGYISEIASIGSFLSPTSWVVRCLLLVIWITTTIPSKKGMWRNEFPFLHIPFLLCFHLVQGSRFRVEGSRGGFAAFFRGWYSRIAAFPSRGRCPAGADRVTMAWKTVGSIGERETHLCCLRKHLSAAFFYWAMSESGIQVTG